MTAGRVVGALALAALAVLWIALRAGERAPAGQTAPMPSKSSVAPFVPSVMPSAPSDVVSKPSDVPSGMPSDMPSDMPSEPPVAEDGATPERQLGPVEAYERYAIYPPDSRPLDARQSDLIDWNRRHESPRIDPDDPGLTVLFTADRYHVVGAQTLSPVLDVRRDGEAAEVQVLDSRVRLPDGRSATFALEPSGEVRAGVIEPAALEVDRPVRLTVEVAFDAGAGPRTARLTATYTPDDAVPARFGEPLGDRVVDGGLEVAVQVHVEAPGLYLFDANLYAAGQPVAWTRQKPRLEAGTHTLRLRFFGKAIVDGGRGGPYTVEQLRGALAAPGQTPPTVQMPPYAGAITTGAHGVADFSGAEWDAPQKRDRLARLKRLEAMGGPVVTTPEWRDSPRREAR